MSDFPAHASPGLPPLNSPPPRDHQSFNLDTHPAATQDAHRPAPPLVTPNYTPPLTPNGTHPSFIRQPSHTTASPQPPPASTDPTAPKLLETLPEVWCEVRARIPTTTGQEMFLHLYHNNVDNKEHLAIVFGPHIRSQSLDAPRPGETERDRMIRGAYTGTLWPGRTSSRVEAIKREAGVGKIGAAEKEGRTREGEERITGTDEEGRELSEEELRRRLGPPLVRIHSECYTGETVWSARCDCGEQLDEAARLMSELCTDVNGKKEEEGEVKGAEDGVEKAKRDDSRSSSRDPGHKHKWQVEPSLGGVIVYLRQEGRGIGLLAKLQAYNLQDLGADTMQANLLLRHPADARSYGLATAMLLDLGLGGERGIRLLTNNPDKVRAVEGPNREVSVVERVPMIPLAWKTGGKEGVKGKDVERYISTKIEKFKHMFSE
ncbi:putative GTP cyclohydrolase II [Elsinoe australis]|uniref:GTP cyclohydrolase II n=1 Tax=Elsinoe australis TaxID=40998 RepID=A0A4U7AZU5_9PEZI|nr:putative GTP cyclohydrolase II [Elsinoe australis]